MKKTTLRIVSTAWLLDPRAPKIDPPPLVSRMFEKWKGGAVLE